MAKKGGLGGVLLGLGALVAAGIGTVAVVKSRARKAGEPIGGGSVAVSGKSGISWVLSPSGEQTGPALGTMTWTAMAAPASKFKDDTGQTVELSAVTPVLAFLQRADDISSRTFQLSYIQGKGWSALAQAAVGDLGIKGFAVA
jgi:hypothetical protein